MHRGPFEEFTLINARQKIRHIDEMVFTAILLAWPGGAGRHRNRQADVRIAFQQQFYQRRLASPGRCRHDIEMAAHAEDS